MTALHQAKPHTLHPACSSQKARVHRTWSERASAACSRLRFGLAKGGPCGRRSRLHNARLNGAGCDAPPSAWQAVKRSLVCGVASRLRQVKRSLCMACVRLAWRGVMRRVVLVRWRACVGAVCAPLRHALAVCMCVCTHAPQTSCA